MINTSLFSGRCLVCGTRFVGMTEDVYNSTVSRHIVDNHRDQPADKVVVRGGPCE